MATLKVSVILAFLKKRGFKKVDQSGSHHKFLNPSTQKIVIVPVHGRNKDVPIGTVMGIIKQSGIAKSEWPLP